MKIRVLEIDGVRLTLPGTASKRMTIWNQGNELLPQAVCALFLRKGSGGKIEVLSISRGEDERNLGLPGGKVEAKETPRQAVVREVFEETGILFDQRDAVPVYTALVNSYLCTTFLVNRCQVPSELKSEPFEGYVKWVEPKMLTQPKCSFAPYNYRLLESLGLL